MRELTLFYATNRNHLGNQRNPDGYGTKFSDDGVENLRFGVVKVQADENEIDRHLQQSGKYGVGNGIDLAEYLTKQAAGASITAYQETIPDRTIAESHQPGTVLGSRAMFFDVKKAMEQKTDALVYIHGFDVSWHDAVGSALALQEVLNASSVRDTTQGVMVILLTWPSDGMALPFVSYKSDRTEAKASGYAFGRGLLKLRDFLFEVCKDGNPCGQNIHLLCHSMGNYVLQNTVQRLAEFTPRTLPRVFEQVFMCAPDVDDDVFEDGKPLARLPEIADSIGIFHNREDKAMFVSDYTKGNPERLGGNGAAHPTLLHNKINQINCTPVVAGEGFVEHSYYLVGHVMDDIRMSLDGLAPDDGKRRRVRSDRWPNLWTMS